MPTPTYTRIASTTLASASGAVTFSSIPATYRDLIVSVVILGLTTSPTTRDSYLTLNGTGGSSVFMYGAGSGVSGTRSEIHIPYGPYQNHTTVEIMDYSATDKHKTIIKRNGSASNVDWAIASRWPDTAAVNSITFNAPDSGTRTFIAGSVFTLYGIVA
jgi:hypothetical protein